MTKLKQGSLFISYDDIRQHMGLTSDTQLTVEAGSDGIEIRVIASDDNKQEWLTDILESAWNIARVKIQLNKERDRGITVKGSDGQGFTISNDGMTKIEGVIQQNNFLENFVYMVMKELGYTPEEVLKGELNSKWAEEFSKKIVETLKRERSLI